MGMRVCVWMANFNRRVQGKQSKDTYQTNIMRGEASLSLFHRHWKDTPHPHHHHHHYHYHHHPSRSRRHPDYSQNL